MNKNLPRLFKNPFSRLPFRTAFRGLRLHRKELLLLRQLMEMPLLQPSKASVRNVLAALWEE